VDVRAGGPVRHRQMRAQAGLRVATIGRAGIVVVAIDRRAGAADPGLTGFGAVAGVAVRAWSSVRDGEVATTQHGIAAVARAGVAVVAIGRRAAHAGAARADVGRGAGVAVVARGGVVRVHTAGRRVAPGGRAEVAVVAVERRSARTAAAAASIAGRARVAVVAGGGVVGMHTSGRPARVVGAGIAVVAALAGRAAGS